MKKLNWVGRLSLVLFTGLLAILLLLFTSAFLFYGNMKGKS